MLGLLTRGATSIADSASILASAWIAFLAFFITWDVVARGVFSAPLTGTAEIVAHSLVAITFLQLPAAIAHGSLLRATVIYDRLGTVGKRIVNTLAYLFGLAFFTAILVGGWSNLVTGWQIREFAGHGALRVPIYLVRTLVFAFSLYACLIYLLLIQSVWVAGYEEQSASE